MCTACGGGKLRFDYKNGVYTCPGYMDDDEFRNCRKKFDMSEITRSEWIKVDWDNINQEKKLFEKK